MIDGVECMKQAHGWSDSDDPTHRVRRFVDCNNTEQRPQGSKKLVQSQEELQSSGSLDLGLRVGTHWDGIDVAIRHHRILRVVSRVFQCLPALLAESGCLLKSTSGPLCLGFGCAGVQLATVAALGLKALSVGPLNECREGWSYRKGGSTPMVT